jgi:hypothetical protein
MLNGLLVGVKLARDVRSFLQRPWTIDECRRLLGERLARRDESFLRVMTDAVFQNPRSPYGALLGRAKIERGDVLSWVGRGGVEGALAELFDAGVYVTLDEFKGRRPIRRPGLEVAVHDHDFDNPFAADHFETRTGGGRDRRGIGTRVMVDLDLLALEAGYEGIFLASRGAMGRPMALWRPVLPAVAGMKNLLRHAKVGMYAERWFSQNPLRFAPSEWRHYAFTRYVLHASRAGGRPLPMPEHVPLADARVVARWLAEKSARGTPAYLEASASSAVRACLAARADRLDITGTLFRVDSEPLTEGRARIVLETGSQVYTHYSTAEAGRLGVACAAPAAVDDVHVARDKVALLQRERRLGAGLRSVGALYWTTLHPAHPKIMLNVEMGDYGVVVRRDCGCPFGELGLRDHLHTVLSYDKLTSEGMQFTGSDLVRLVEDVLPGRFGGSPTDYQLVEQEEGGLPRVSVVVSPRVGPIDEAGLLRTVLETLGSPAGGHRMMAGYWRDANTLRVVRGEPYATGAGKIFALHVIK